MSIKNLTYISLFAVLVEALVIIHKNNHGYDLCCTRSQKSTKVSRLILDHVVNCQTRIHIMIIPKASEKQYLFGYYYQILSNSDF